MIRRIQKEATEMPLIEITIGPLDEQQKRQIARGISKTLTDAGIPEEAITIIFRHITGKDVAKGGGFFPYWPENLTS
jgi:phenylpyruvate tautomerase PptA (4-oxalocrotonate tautomerase family)